MLAALRMEGSRFEVALEALDAADSDRPTRCPPWSVRDLLAHVLVACDRLPTMLSEDAPSSADVNAWAYFRSDRRFSDDANAARVDAARRLAGSSPSGNALAAAVGDAVRRMADAAAGEPHDRLIRTRWGDAMLLDDFLATRVLELVVHGLDIARALDRSPWTSTEAAAATLTVLVDGRPDEALARTGWEAVELIERATGRAPLRHDERVLAHLRPLALG